jgi:integrase/recombinase XerC
MLDAFVEHMRRYGAQSTMENRRWILTMLNNDLEHGVGETTGKELGAWLHKQRVPAWSDNTRATYYRAIKAAYTFWTDPADPWISYDPTRNMKRVPGVNGVANPVEDEELERILTEAKQPVRLWALIAAYQGLRCIEISGLDREHVTESRLIVVRGKGGRPRVHDTDPAVWAAIRELPPGPIARHPQRGDRATRQEVCHIAIRHFTRDLGMPDIGLHRLRHWLGCTVQARYRDVRVTQVMLGHASLASTQIYTRATDDQQREARSLLPRFGE